VNQGDNGIGNKGETISRGRSCGAAAVKWLETEYRDQEQRGRSAHMWGKRNREGVRKVRVAHEVHGGKYGKATK